jgi:hypothetical protein
MVHPAAAQVASFDDRPSGFLTAAAGGMPADAWQNTPLATAKKAVSSLSPAPRSRALRDLQFKVMVSALNPPANDGSAPPGLFGRKVERLAAMGEGESLNEMVRAAGGYEDPAIAATVVNAMMMAGEREGACAIVAKHKLPSPFAKRAEVACLFVAGDDVGALAAVSQPQSSDAGLVTLTRVASGSLPPSAAPLAPLDGPAMIMLALAHVTLPAAVLRSDQPPLIRALIAQKTLPIGTRLEIAERGEALAVIEATRLGDLYVEAVRDGAPMSPAMAKRAQLVAAVRAADNPKRLMPAIAALYADTQGSPLFPTVARAGATGLLSLPPKPEYANVAQEAIRGFLLLGDTQLTKVWTKLALTAAFNNARALNALDRLVPLIAVAGIDNPHRLPAEEINRWYELMRVDDARSAPLRGNLMLELLRASGVDVPPGATDLPEAPPAGTRLVSPPATVLQAVQSAAGARRRAEASVLAASAIAETPLANLHPAAVGAIVRALIAAGEGHAGRLFAIETAIAHGL